MDFPLQFWQITANETSWGWAVPSSGQAELVCQIGVKLLGAKKMLAGKKLRPKQSLGKKKVWAEKVWAKKKFEQNKVWPEKKFVVKKS